jgi:hypothetical protein
MNGREVAKGHSMRRRRRRILPYAHRVHANSGRGYHSIVGLPSPGTTRSQPRRSGQETSHIYVMLTESAVEYCILDSFPVAVYWHSSVTVTLFPGARQHLSRPSSGRNAGLRGVLCLLTESGMFRGARAAIPGRPGLIDFGRQVDLPDVDF